MKTCNLDLISLNKRIMSLEVEIHTLHATLDAHESLIDYLRDQLESQDV